MIWILHIITLLAALPWGLWLAAKSTVKPPTVLACCLALAIQTGGISLVMFWTGLLGLPLTARWTTEIYLLAMLPGGYFLVRARAGWPPPNHRILLHPVVWLLALICAAVLFNALYWPFYRDDALGIYRPYAVVLSETGALAPVERPGLYEMYPQLVTLNYAYTYLAAGWQNDYAAKLPATLLSLATLPATYLLGRTLTGDDRVGWLAALLMALTPTFGKWASTGYVDLPMAFFYALGGVFAWRSAHGGNLFDAALGGAALALAAWTKNAALVGVAVFALWTLGAWALRRITFKVVFVAGATCALIGAPWYLRNLVFAGALTPDTVWTDQAQQTLREIFVLVTLPQNFGPAGWLMLAGVVVAAWRLLRRRDGASALLLWWSAPYYVSWLLYASYDPRFIVLILPQLAVMGALVAVEVRLPRRAVPVAWGLAALMALYVTFNSLEFKRALLSDPLMGHEAKVSVVRPG